ncbi:MAG: hypothetical protein H6Q04_1247 [Acidobacteria bacterium]|nr:hypothetical protein [Acidobacteriota bacterium]
MRLRQFLAIYEHAKFHFSMSHPAIGRIGEFHKRISCLPGLPNAFDVCNFAGKHVYVMLKVRRFWRNVPVPRQWPPKAGDDLVSKIWNLLRNERLIFQKLSKPEKIQAFLDQEIQYNTEPNGPSCRSPRRVLRDGIAHCIEGALFAAASLRYHGRPPLILDLEAVRDDDHIVALYKESGHWGAIAKSNYSGLRFREPVYRTLRELVMTYFEHYFNHSFEKTLRRYSNPVNLARFDKLEWMTSENDLWEIGDYLCKIPHRQVLTGGQIRRLRAVDPRLYQAGLFGSILSKNSKNIPQRRKER